MKQSSIEFLLDKFGDVIGDINTTNDQDLMLMEIIKQAKAMHKEEIVDALINGMHKGQDIYFSEGKVKLDVNSLNYCIGIAEDYYNETFNSEEK